MALAAFRNHGSQGITGFLNSPFLRQPPRIKAANGKTFDRALLAKPITTTLESEGKGEVERADHDLMEAREAALRLDWARAVKALAGAGREIEPLLSGHPRRSVAPSELTDLSGMREKINQALASAAALRVETQADRSEVVPGETFTVRAEVRARASIPLQLGKLELVAPQGWTVSQQSSDETRGVRFEVSVPRDARQSSSAADSLLPFPKPLLDVKLHVMADDYSFHVWTPVLSTKAPTTRAETFPGVLGPPYTM